MTSELHAPGEPPFVSVVIPARNESADIESCLRFVQAQTWPADRFEVILADAVSSDDTVAKAVAATARVGISLRVVSNPQERTSVGLNNALAAARGSVVVRVDSRSQIAPRHVELAVRHLTRDPRVGVVGGGQRAQARSPRPVEQGIARALSNRFTTGLSRYRRGTEQGPADTVWMGSFRTEDLRKLGGWSDDLTLNQDYELNERYRDAGFVVWFDPAMDAGYLPRPTLAKLRTQYFRFGRAKGRWWATGHRVPARQMALLITPPVLAAVAVVGAIHVGVVPVLALGAIGALAVDALGNGASADRAGATERALAVAATAVFTSAWWSGVVVGFVGDRNSARHAHA